MVSSELTRKKVIQESMTAASLHEAMDMKNSMHKPVRRGGVDYLK
jgi:hypothetical protein